MIFGGPVNLGRLWLVPFIAGIGLMGFALALLRWPELAMQLIAYFFAFLSFAGGLALVRLGWSLRHKATYQQLSRTWHVENRQDVERHE